jgi:hypothetical protein
MGIDIYATWRNQSDEEREKQFTGFDALKGHVGYLREAYHGEPYATRYFVKEAFEAQDHEARIDAKTLKERLPKTLGIVRDRETTIYQQKDEYQIWQMQKSYVDFYKLCQKREKESGEPCAIEASY